MLREERRNWETLFPKSEGTVGDMRRLGRWGFVQSLGAAIARNDREPKPHEQCCGALRDQYPASGYGVEEGLRLARLKRPGRVRAKGVAHRAGCAILV